MTMHDWVPFISGGLVFALFAIVGWLMKQIQPLEDRIKALEAAIGSVRSEVLYRLDTRLKEASAPVRAKNCRSKLLHDDRFYDCLTPSGHVGPHRWEFPGRPETRIEWWEEKEAVRMSPRHD